MSIYIKSRIICHREMWLITLNSKKFRKTVWQMADDLKFSRARAREESRTRRELSATLYRGILSTAVGPDGATLGSGLLAGDSNWQTRQH